MLKSTDVKVFAEQLNTYLAQACPANKAATTYPCSLCSVRAICDMLTAGDLLDALHRMEKLIEKEEDK